MRKAWRVSLAAAVFAAASALIPAAAPGLEEGFRNPPIWARPATYYVLLNGYVNHRYVEEEIRELHRAGIGGLCIFDMGARGDAAAVPPAGPAFLSPESVRSLGRIIRAAGRLGMEVDLSVSSSWDMGGSWVEPEDGSMTLVVSEMELEGPREFDGLLPFPAVPAGAPRDARGRPEFYREVAVLGVRDPDRRRGYEFVFELPGESAHVVTRAVLYNTRTDDPEAGPLQHFAKDFVLAVSDTVNQAKAYREVLRGSLAPRTGAQEFRFEPAPARYVRLEILNGHDERSERVELGEFELYDRGGVNVLLSHRANRMIDGAHLVRFTSALGQLGVWSAGNIHDGVRGGPRGSWASAGPPSLAVADRSAVVDLSERLDAAGRLRWRVPPGRWTILRYVCTNTGERLKVPSPNSDGLATDHLNAAATRRYIREVVERLRAGIGDLRRSALKELYLASYEVRGRVWTPGFLDEFRRRRGYDLKPYLPVLQGGVVGSEDESDRVRYDYEKTLGELVVDAYYRAAAETARAAGLGIESEAGGPGPPIHWVPVDALLALGSVDTVRGEFWPFRPHARAMWVVKETASAAHIYGKRRVHMEAFTSSMHWQESPQDLKASADRAFCEGMNYVVWHTASHQPPEAGKPGWVYYAGTHLGPNRVWWPMVRPFLEYLARASFLLQQGLFVADVVYYYGDQGFNFVEPKHVDPRLGFGYDYDVTNAEVILKRMSVRDGKIVLPDGMSYELLALPDRSDIDPDVLGRIGELVEAGATVVGRKPRRATGFSDAANRDRRVRELADRIWGDCDGEAVRQRRVGRGAVVCGLTLRQVLEQRGVGPDFMVDGERPESRVDFIHRRTPDAEIYFVRNKQSRPQEINPLFRVRDREPEIWLPDTGEIRRPAAFSRAAGGVRVRLRLAPEEALFVVFRRRPRPGGVPADADAGSKGVAEDSPPLAIDGPWSVRFPENWGAPETAVFPRLIPWTEHEDPGIRYFSGIAEYETKLTVPADWLQSGRRIVLDLGRLWAVAEVEWNGRPVGVAWKQPFRLDVTPAVRAGENQLRVRVANTWANRLIGDALGVGGRRFTRTNVEATTPARTPWAKLRPIPSGLFGPVVLRQRRSR